MEWTKFLVGGAAVGVVLALWKQIKALVWKGLSVFVQEVEIRDPAVAAAVVAHLVSRYRRLGPATRAYSASIDYHLRDGQRRLGNIAYERFGTHSLLFRRRIWPLLFEASSSGSNAAYPEVQAGAAQKQASGGAGAAARLFFLRRTVDSDGLIAEAVREWNRIGWELSDRGAGSRRRFFIKYLPSASKEKGSAGAAGSSWQYFKNIRLLDLEPAEIGLGANRRGGMLERLFFPDEVRTLIEEVKTWRRSQDWFESRGIPWKRGWLLHGKPGTGKTALAGAFAYDLDLPIFVFNLTEMGNTEFMSEWRGMLASAPCIALIEDIDAVFHGRENISRRGHGLGAPGQGGSPGATPGDAMAGRQGLLSFDVLLNCIDGVDRAEGVFTIITTNRVEVIDPALGQPARRADGSYEFVSTRPGRIDRAIELTDMEPYVKKRMAAYILDEFPAEAQAMIRHIDGHPEELETPAQFLQRCSQIALDCFWAREKGLSHGTAMSGCRVDNGDRKMSVANSN
jgi:hypothetical protein